MVQRTKSSNKAVLAEARNDRDTATTLAGPSQCDEDDYGYESKAQDSMYQKLMAKFDAAPEDPMAKFSKGKKSHSGASSSSSSSMSKVKDRVKERLATAEAEEEAGRRRSSGGSSRPSSSSASSSSGPPKQRKRRDGLSWYEPEKEEAKKSRKELEAEAVRKRRLQAQKAPPPTASFADLMKMAQQKHKEQPTAEVDRRQGRVCRQTTNR